MSSRRLIDTNVIVRHLTKDSPREAKVAQRIFEAADRGELILLVLPAVVAECVFVLESFYKLPRAKIAQAINSFVTSPGVELADRPSHLDALKRYAKTKMHFVDCLIAATAVDRGLPVATLDADFKKFPDVSVDLS
jgi:predicted nucleic acid-binding protein